MSLMLLIAQDAITGVKEVVRENTNIVAKG